MKKINNMTKIAIFGLTVTAALSLSANTKDHLGYAGPFTLNQYSTQELEVPLCSEKTTELKFKVKKIGSSRLNHRQYVLLNEIVFEYPQDKKEVFDGKVFGKTHRFDIELDRDLGCPEKIYLTAKNARLVSGKPSSVFISIMQATGSN